MHNTMADVRTRLEAQHEHIKELLVAVRTAGDGTDRAEAFDRLRSYLAAHEAAEEAHLHAHGHRLVGKDAAVDARRAEEEGAERAMQQIESLELNAPAFDAWFANFESALIAHAEAEEHEELPRLDGVLTPDQVDDVIVALRRVSAVAEMSDGSGSFSEQLQRARDDFSHGHERDAASSISPPTP
jgi:hypothetical protein